MEYYSAITKNEIISFAVTWMDLEIIIGFQGGASGKERTCQCRRYKRHKSHPWVRKIPWRRKQQPTPGFLPGESHAWWATVHRVTELDTTEATEHTQLFNETQNSSRKVVKQQFGFQTLCVLTLMDAFLSCGCCRR